MRWDEMYGMVECKDRKGIWVPGYRKNDGTWVQGYCKDKPNEMKKW